MRILQLFEHVQARAFLGLLAYDSIKLLPDAIQLLLNLAQAGLPFLDRAPAGQHVELLRLHVGGEFLQTRFEARAFLFELNFLRRKFFQPHHVALLLQIQRVDLVAHLGELLRGGKGIRLRAAHRVLLGD